MLSFVSASLATPATLAPRAFEPLPLGAIAPQGWLQDQLVRQASSLSGYLRHPDEKAFGEVTFSILANNQPGGGGHVLRPFQDAMVVALANARAR